MTQFGILDASRVFLATRNWFGMRVRRRTLLSIASAFIPLIACNGEASPVLEDALLPPGTALNEDFVVPEGTRLIGSRFPSAYQEGAWSALLLVEGDPLDVVRDLLDQATASDLAVPSGSPCRVHQDAVLECDLEASGADPARGYVFLLRWGQDQGATYRHVLVFAGPHRFEGDEPSEEVSTADRVPALDLPPPPKPIEEWDAPEIGEPVAVIPGWFVEQVIVVESGSRVVAPDGPAGCGTGGYTAVLRVHGDPDDLVARYMEQFEDLGFEGELGTGSFEGRRYVAATSGTAGGGELDAIARVGARGEANFLLLSRCND